MTRVLTGRGVPEREGQRGVVRKVPWASGEWWEGKQAGWEQCSSAVGLKHETRGSDGG